ncbi:MAG: hypothetical protein EXQ79_03720 [Acidimicrobiia bacterium]|nr:hypothetical protein [Acidimicrobiia bacterium]
MPTDQTGDQTGDTLPEDLDVTAYVGPYLFPDIRRRRIAGALHAFGAVVALAAGLTSNNSGLVIAGVVLAAIAGYHFVAGWHVALDQTAALAAASRAVGFPVGHASAQLGWRGLRSRPSWRILLYSADAPPTQRGLVEVDAVDGRILGQYAEENPEDWSQYGITE